VRLLGDKSMQLESFSSRLSVILSFVERQSGPNAPRDNARDSASLHPATGGPYVFYFELRGGEYLGSAYALVGRPAEIEQRATIRDWSDPSLQGDGTELMKGAAVSTEWVLCL
jgi:hypothetical protein